jgi:hypothetical protein
MAAELPLQDLTLRANSLADDLGFVALADLAHVLADVESRVIGGHMVQLHVYRWGLGSDLYRATQDADLGVPLMAAQDPSLVTRLEDLGYERLAGNRFGRVLDDIPVTGVDDDDRRAVIDILVPAYTSRPRHTRRIGNHLVTTEVPGLAEAFRRPPVRVGLELVRLNGEVLKTAVVIPDERSALILKVMAWRTRAEPKDAVDVWRCCEVAVLARVHLSDRAGKTGETVVQELQRDVERRDGRLVTSIVESRRLSASAGDALHTRLRALVNRIGGEEVG